MGLQSILRDALPADAVKAPQDEVNPVAAGKDLILMSRPYVCVAIDGRRARRFADRVTQDKRVR